MLRNAGCLPSWDPAQDAALGDHRSSPFADLVGRVASLDLDLRPRLVAVLRHADAVPEPDAYPELLGRLGLAADVWETTYGQLLDPDGEQAAPVLEGLPSTGLRPVLDVLTDRHAFPFRRIFAVGRKPW